MMILKGTIFTLAKGEYDDYDLYAICEALTDINLEQIKEEYLFSHQDKKFKYYQFVRWLIDNKRAAKEIQYCEWHLGSYGEADFKINIPDKTFFEEWEKNHE